MENFRGDLKWVHKWEGHLGKPYWPKGRSGVTLDPGVDLGYAEWDLVERAYGPLIEADLLQDLSRTRGIKGDEAGQFLEQARNENAPFTRIRIKRDQGDELFGIVAEPYWKGISKRFGALLRENTPGAVQTVFLSLAYNRGVNNRDFEQLHAPLDGGDFKEVGRLVGGMQQDHKLAGIRRRRQEEGKLILENV